MTTPLRVLHVCAGNLYGGVERIVAQCAGSRQLVPSMEPSFAVCFEGRLAGELDATGVSCARLGPVRVRAPWSVVRARAALGRVIDARRPHAAVCHSSWTFALAAPVLLNRGVPATLWLHDRVNGRTWVERWARRRTPDLVISNSAFTAASLHNMYSTVRSVVLYAPVPPGLPELTADRARLRQEFGVADETPVVIIASRFEAWKGHRDLFAALAGISEPWHLWVAGGAQRPAEAAREHSLRALAGDLGIDSRVRFLGERRDVAALMGAGDLHCQPNSGPEPFGLAFVEALHAGLPVVTTDLGGAREIVTPCCGSLVPPGDPAALRLALRRLLRDASERRRLGAAGAARASSLCDPARQLARLADHLASTRRVEAPQ